MADTARTKTTYHVLKLRQPETTTSTAPDAQDDVGAITATTGLEQWEIAARDIPAANADAAVKQHVEAKPDGAAGIYVAVPSRFWKPSTVKVETQTVVKVG